MSKYQNFWDLIIKYWKIYIQLIITKMILAIGPRIIIITLTSIDAENFGNANNTKYIFIYF